jgi:hypothetical protein
MMLRNWTHSDSCRQNSFDTLIQQRQRLTELPLSERLAVLSSVIEYFTRRRELRWSDSGRIQIDQTAQTSGKRWQAPVIQAGNLLLYDPTDATTPFFIVGVPITFAPGMR